MSNVQFLVICGLITGGFSLLGLGILFLYKKMLVIINRKQKEISNQINNKQKDLSNQINNRFNRMPNDLSNLVQYTGDKKTIVIARLGLNTYGGIASRWRTFFPYLEKAGYRIVIITDRRSLVHKEFFPNYKIHFINYTSSLLTEEIIRICNFEKASLIEFHEDSLNINIEKVYSLLPVGFAAHANMYQRTYVENFINFYKELDETYYKYLDFIVEVSGRRRDWFKNVKANVIDFSIDTSKYSSVFKNVGQKKALLVSRLSLEKLRTIEPFLIECQKRAITFDIIGTGAKKAYLQNKYNLADEVFLGQLNAVEYMKNHGSDYLFVAGSSQVPMESLALGYPSLLVFENSCFITRKTFENALYYDFDIITESDITLDEQFDDLYNGNLGDFDCRDLVVKHLDLETNAKKYVAIYEKAMEKRSK